VSDQKSVTDLSAPLNASSLDDNLGEVDENPPVAAKYG
jgi:hypothetical protein